MRKRVTLTVISVSAIFGVCWITGLTIYVLGGFDVDQQLYYDQSASYAYAIADTLFMFNSAVNPFVYSLMNERFRKKIKGTLCCSCASRIHPLSEPYYIELQHISRGPRSRRVNEVQEG